MSSKDLTVILFVENQGRFANPSVKSMEAALDRAVTERGVSTQFVLLADDPDEQTRCYLENHRPGKAEILITSFGSRARATEHALKQAEGTFVALAGTHDLVSSNWIGKAYDESKASKERVVFHPSHIISFGESPPSSVGGSPVGTSGGSTFLYIIPDQTDRDFSKDVLFSRNPWPGPSFGLAETFKAIPMREPNHAKGFGHADWLWVCDTVASGVIHKPVAETFSCCHRRWGHACVTPESDYCLIESSKFFHPGVLAKTAAGD